MKIMDLEIDENILKEFLKDI